MAHVHHTFDYIELRAADLPRAKAFYADAFGWGFTDYGPDYSGITSPDGGEVGGITAAGEGSTGGPLVLLWSDDIAASVVSVTAAGGTVTEGPFEFPGGQRFHFADPAGNVLGIWQAAEQT